MADEDEIDILGEFSFNSCLAQNDQGIPSCSNREDTVHPQWLLDKTANNWYDSKNKKNSEKLGPKRKLSGTKAVYKLKNEVTVWSKAERDLLVKEMEKYGRNIQLLSQAIKTKTETEIQALIEAEYGVNLDTPVHGLLKHEDHDNIPPVVHEEVVPNDLTTNILDAIITGSTTVIVPKQPFRKKQYNKRKMSLLKPNILEAIDPSEIYYDDEFVVETTESLGSQVEPDIVSALRQKEKVKVAKKIGNHRRKISRNYDGSKTRNRSKDNLKSPQRQRKDSSLSEDSVKSPKMQIILGSGQALPLSEGEQVIKIEKKKDSEPESDIEIDVDSGNEDNSCSNIKQEKVVKPSEEPVAVPLRKLIPMPKRQKKINLNGDGGYTIMHTEAGDLYEVGAEPRRERQPRKQPVHLIHCRIYNTDNPAPYSVHVHVSTLVSMDAHAHTSRGEVMGLAGGSWRGGRLTVTAYRAAAAAAGSTHCDMSPESQVAAAEWLSGRGAAVCGWHHSHPAFPPAPSARDLHSQRQMQRAFGRAAPFVAFVTSQHWPAGRTASQYRCFRVEDEEGSDTPVGYQFSVQLVPDLTVDNLGHFLQELGSLLRDRETDRYSVDMLHDVCPQANMCYLEKLISSARHHMQSAGCGHSEPLVQQLLHGIRDIFR